MRLKGVSVSEISLVYNKCKSTRKTAKHFGVAQRVICDRPRGLGVIASPVINSCTERFFSHNTPEAFYWAGFIAADGCIVDTRGCKKLSIMLSVKDEALLVNLKKHISYSGPVYHSMGVKGNTRSQIIVSSDLLCSDLNSNFGITPRKSLTLAFSAYAGDSALVNHFMRGYFDGDGCIHRRGKNLTFVLCGTEGFLIKYKDILAVQAGVIGGGKISRQKNIYTLTHSSMPRILKIRDFYIMGQQKIPGLTENLLL
jgi:hypothetical protein